MKAQLSIKRTLGRDLSRSLHEKDMNVQSLSKARILVRRETPRLCYPPGVECGCRFFTAPLQNQAASPGPRAPYRSAAGLPLSHPAWASRHIWPTAGSPLVISACGTWQSIQGRPQKSASFRGQDSQALPTAEL